MSELEEHELSRTKDEIEELRWNLETYLGEQCYQKEMNSPEHRFGLTIKRFGLPFVSQYKCDCPKIHELTDEEVLKRSGLL